MAKRKITVKFTDRDGKESSKTLDEGSTISALVGSGNVCILNGEQVDRDVELRAGDHVEEIRRSAKAG